MVTETKPTVVTLELEFTKERETKNTVRYQEVGTVTAVGVLYVQKDVLRALGSPEKLKVLIEVG